jgi:ABC-type uncharacterized transport system ATPase subunit
MLVDLKDENLTAVTMHNISKKFPGGVLANDNVDFETRVGEIHGLLGENGAGKTTLMNILYGLYQPDTGSIEVFRQQVTFRSPADAISRGIGMVHQHFKLVSDMSATENIVLGLKSPRGALTDLKSAEERISSLAKQHGLSVDPKGQIWQLSVGERQRVEILKALYRDAKILILDEPTSVLAPTEIKDFFNSLRQLKDSGISIILITHKLDEVMDVTDRVTVLRRGHKIATQPTKEVNQARLAQMMIGEEIPPIRNKTGTTTTQTVLKVVNLHVFDDRGIEAVKGVSIDVHEGEILGIAGVSGNGQRELVQAIVGLRKTISGTVEVSGVDVTGKQPRKIIDLKVAYVPENRNEDGTIGDFGIDENLILKDFTKTPICKKIGPIPILIDDEQVANRAKEAIDKFGIRTTGRSAKARSLSGGNLQRLILARELVGRPSLVVVSQPTRGLDVAATEYVRSILIEQRNNGSAILLIDEDLGELLTISDRVAVMYKGEIVGVLKPGESTPEEMGQLMTGVKRMITAS